MKHYYTAIAMLTCSVAAAQCTFTPTITPDPLLVCPVGFTQAYTQSYDGYQWYENGSAILGATNIFLELDASSIGNTITVECTVDGCTEMSAPVTVDGYVFLPPTVMTAGDEPAFWSQNGPVYCPGDTVLLIMGQPYTISIQWANNGVTLPGEVDDTLVVNGPGYYSVSGAPAECPGYVQPLGLDVPIFFMEVIIPQIMETDGMLCITPSNPVSYQWYFQGAPIITDECFVPGASGAYTVSANYGESCGPMMSDPFIVMGTNERTPGVGLMVWPQPAGERCTVGSSEPLRSAWRLLDAAGREVRTGQFHGCTQCELSLEGLHTGNYTLVTEHGPLRVTVVR